MNVAFTDGREKTILLGYKYLDDRNGVLYMQDREGWLKPSGKGWIVYLQMGHTVHEFQHPAVAQMVLNAITWKPAFGGSRGIGEYEEYFTRRNEGNGELFVKRSPLAPFLCGVIAPFPPFPQYPPCTRSQ